MTSDCYAGTGVKPKKNSHRSLILTLVTFCVIAASVATTTQQASAQTPTPEQLRQLEQLSPAQRAVLLDALGGQQAATQQAPVSEPTVVNPRRVAQPAPASTEVEEGAGIEGLTETTARERSRPDLKPFGYDLFAGEPTTFAPATDIPVPVDYIVGPGDTVELQLFGNKNALYSLAVTREGMLNLPELGPIAVAGQTFSELQSTLQQRISEQMIGVQASITMGRLRSIRIFILGDAYRPGSYTVSALSTMTNALFVSGGINSIGSLRNIELKRRGRLVTTLDLYDLLLRGDTSGDSRLQPGDVIFIPPVGRTVGIDGEVRRPAIYELKDERSARDVLELAGGLLPTAFPKATQIDRINERQERTIVSVDLSSNAGLTSKVEDDDVIRVYSVLEKREDIVRLSGHVYRDGAFQWKPGMRLSDLIPSVKELKPQADLHYVLIRRELPDELQIEVTSADLAVAMKHPGSKADLLLQPRDQVTVFDLDGLRAPIIEPILEALRIQSRHDEPVQVASVGGRVHTPGRYPLEPGMRVSDLLRAGGQLDEAAYALEAELSRTSVDANQYTRIDLITIDLARVLAGDQSADILLMPHDQLNIRRVPLWGTSETVELRGEVKFPGNYPIRRGERLSSVIARAGGLTEFAFADGAIFLRERLRLREQVQLEALSERLRSEVESAAVAEQAGDADSIAARKALLEQVNQTQATGRLVIELAAILEMGGGSSADVILQSGDRLLIPKLTETVTIIGEVQFPTSHVFAGNINRAGYISMSGGTTFNADKKRIYVVRANGSVVANNGSRFFRRRGREEIRPGDTIVVPLDANRISKLTFWTNVTTILYNVGIATAAVASF